MPPEPTISVLHVDDDPDQLQIAKLILEETDPNLHVQSTGDPHEALRRITQQPVDCIVTDYKMPNLNGIQLATKIRQHTDTPIILYTGQGSEKLAEEAFAIGVDDYIRKEPEPSHYQVLAKRIRSAVDKHRAESLLQRSEENYRNVVDHASQGIIVVQDGLLRFVNPKVTQMTGYAPEELIGKPFMDYLHPEDRHQALEKYRNRHTSETTFYPFRITAKNGDVRWIEVNGIGIDWDGSEATLHFLTDVTERKHARAEIDQREEQYRALFETSPFAISLHDLNGEISSVNTAFTELTGFTEEELKGKTLTAIASQRKVGQEKIDFIAEMRRALLSDGELSSFEYPFKRKNGSERWSQVYASLLHMDGKRTGIQVLAHDITDQKTMREELQRSEENYKRLIESAPDAITTADLRGYITSVNQKVTQVTGIPREELVGKHITQLGFITPEYRSILLKMLGPVLRGELPGPFNVRTRRGDGSHIFSEVQISPLKEDGKTIGFQAISRDITERQRMETELKEANLALEGLVEEKTQELLDAERLVTAGRIAATVGHDLRGPLQTIKNAVYLMRQSPENVDEMIDMINKSVDRASEMIDMFRSQTRYSPLILGDVNLVEMVRKTVEEATLPQSVEAVLELDERLESVYLDGTKIQRVLDNLIQNAVEAMPTGGKLTVTAKRARSIVTLTVSDTGVGIPEDVTQSLFKPFHTTKEGGLGLGLYYCKRTVEAHEGTIELGSEVGAGTTFTIKIPVFTEDYLSHFEAQAIRSTLIGQ